RAVSLSSDRSNDPCQDGDPDRASGLRAAMKPPPAAPGAKSGSRVEKDSVSWLGRAGPSNKPTHGISHTKERFARAIILSRRTFLPSRGGVVPQSSPQTREMIHGHVRRFRRHFGQSWEVRWA